MDDTKRLVDVATRVVLNDVRSDINVLQHQPKLRYEPVKPNVNDPRFTSFLDKGIYKCAHGQWLYRQCSKCGRGPDEALDYAQAMRFRLEALLKDISTIKEDK